MVSGFDSTAYASASAARFSSLDVVDPQLLTPPDLPIHGGWRLDAAMVLDGALLTLAGMDGHSRRVQAHLTRRLVEMRAWKPIGFVRLSDYARERLGVSPRSLEDDAHVMRMLDDTPHLRAAFESGVVNWTKVRLLCRVATAQNEQSLLRRALTLSTRALEEFVCRYAQQQCATNSEERTRDETVADEETSKDSSSKCAVDGTEFNADDPEISWSIPISRSGRRIWRAACEFASRSAGAPLSPAAVLELVVAEAVSGAPRESAAVRRMPSMENEQRRLLELQRHDHERGHRSLLAFLAEVGVVEGFGWLAPAASDAGPAHILDHLLDGLDDADGFELDRRLRDVRLAMHRIDSQMAALLRIGVDRRLFRELGFATVKLYVESRLGCSPRKVWSLIAVERGIWRSCPQLRDAWRDGRVSHLAACALLPVISEKHGDAWIRRAGEVTLRRLLDEVAWSLDYGDRNGRFDRPAPPPLDAEIRIDGSAGVAEAEVQIRAHGEENCSGMMPLGTIRLACQAPVSVAALVELALWQLRVGNEPRWRTFERMVALALLEWTGTPKHRDPVFERDGWRCSVPGCSSRRNLHDHHVLFRSHGGGNARDNRVTVCAAHHLHGLHAGTVRAYGHAPSQVVWELGCDRGRRPLMRLLGDRVLA